MYFSTYGLRKTWLDKCLKNPVTWETSRNTFETWTTVPLPYLLIAANAIQLKKISLRDMQNIKTVC